jgi:hypothetical protein
MLNFKGDHDAETSINNHDINIKHLRESNNISVLEDIDKIKGDLYEIKDENKLEEEENNHD